MDGGYGGYGNREIGRFERSFQAATGGGPPPSAAARFFGQPDHLLVEWSVNRIRGLGLDALLLSLIQNAVVRPSGLYRQCEPIDLAGTFGATMSDLEPSRIRQKNAMKSVRKISLRVRRTVGGSWLIRLAWSLV